MYFSTKTYGNERGFSCCFRQWRARHSHCSFFHGYSIGVKLVFRAPTLDERNWVYDFGGLRRFENWLKSTFDHKTLVARDDPHFNEIMRLANLVEYDEKGEPREPFTYEGNYSGRPMSVVVVDAVGCEAFAKMAFDKMEEIVEEERAGGRLLNPGAEIVQAEVFEHGANSAIYKKDIQH